MRKRLLAIIATAAMVVAMVPSMVFADAATTLPAADANGVIKLTEDVELSGTFTVNAGETRTIDLNGFTITGKPVAAEAYSVIINKGNLTIKGSGSIICKNDLLTANNGVAINTITNGGNLTINGGTIENIAEPAKTQIGYAIDNNSGNGDAIVTINAGTIKVSGSGYYDGIRQFCNSSTNENSVIVNGGSVSSIWMQNPSDGSGNQNTKNQKGAVTINAGTVGGLYLEPSTNFNVSVTGGEIDAIEIFDADPNKNPGNLSEMLPAGFVTGGTIGEMDESFLAEGYVQNEDGTVIDPSAPSEGGQDAAKPEKSPNTGDNSMAPIAVAGLVLAAMAAVVATRRRTN